MPVNNLRADQEGWVVVNNGTALSRTDGTNLQTTTHGVTGGYTSVGGAAVLAQSTFTGNTGSTAYTITDVVAALKAAGILAQ